MREVRHKCGVGCHDLSRRRIVLLKEVKLW